MRHFSISSILVIVFSNLIAQVNVVPNPGFSELATPNDCPNNFAQVDKCANWTNGNAGSVDFHHTCHQDGIVGVPNNIFGSQQPLTGQGYLSFLTASNDQQDFREYAQTTVELIKDSVYFVLFFVSLAENSTYASNNIGIYIDPDQPNSNGILNFSENATIETNTIVTDTDNWFPVSGFFIPSVSGTHFVTIGNFDTDALTDTVQVQQGGLGVALYYLDNVQILGPSCCPQEMRFENTDNLPAETHVADIIVAGNDAGIPGTSGNVTVKANQTVVFKAGKEIHLGPGFSAEGEFSASIEPCDAFTMPNGADITILQNPTQLNKCNSFIYQIEQEGAQYYSVEIFDQASQLVHFASGAVTSNFITLWDYSSAADAFYTVNLVLTNCEKKKEATYQVQVITSGCKTSFPADEEGNDDPEKETTDTQKQEEENVVEQMDVLVYPNPATTHIMLFYSIPSRQAITFQLLDQSGKVVFSPYNNTSLSKGTRKTSFNISHLAAGIYLYRFTMGDSIKSGELVITK